MPPDSRPPNREAPSPAVGPADQSKHMPDERERRQGKALCLSGGGYRAALFHLGALRRLNELGILSQLDTVTSSSGGSIMSAILADRVQPWPDPGQEFGDWEAKVAVPLREFITHDIRTGPILARLLLPWNWFRISAQAEELARLYYRHLTKQKVLDLPPRPRFVFCATDVVFGANWVCERERMGDYQYGYTTPPEALRVAEAVAHRPAARRCSTPCARRAGHATTWAVSVTVQATTSTAERSGSPIRASTTTWRPSRSGRTTPWFLCPMPARSSGSRPAPIR